MCDGKLQRLKRCSEIEMAITAVGRKQALMRQQFCAARADLLDDKFDQVVKLWTRKHEETSMD